MKFFNTALAATTIAILGSCATINNPEGGPKDELPPKLTSSNPTNKQLSVSTNTIILEFDEEVQPNNLNKELLITPFTENKYRVRTNRNILELNFEKQFEENTTYTFNFRKGIQDITEKNPAQGLQLTFSTGSFIDSSRVSGNVLELLTQKPEKEAVVALFRANDTLSIRKNRPYYQTVTDAAGKFQFENIKEGEYRIYALLDKNDNSLYDNENERIGYLAKPIQITPKPQEVTLQSLRIDTKKPILQQRQGFIDRFSANYNEGIRTFSARPVQSPTDSILYKISTDGKIVDLFGDTRFSGGRAIVTAIDSAGNRTTDTLHIAFQGKRAQRISGAQLKQNGNGNGNGNNAAYRVGQPVTIELETPVKITSKEPITLLADTIAITKLRYPEDIKLDRTATELTFIMPAWNNRNKQVTIALDSMGIAPVQGAPLEFVPLQLTVAETKGTGSIKGTIATKQPAYILELLDSNYKVKRQVRNPKSLDIRSIEPGTYYLRFIIDENKDGKWNGGDPDLKKEPEKVFMYDKPIEVRANWEVEAIKIEF